MTPRDFIIVIGRQFGSGGSELGKILSKRLDMPYYDKQLLTKAASRFGFDETIFEQADERKPSFIRSMFGINYAPAATDYYDSSLNNDRLYVAQSEIIRQLAKEGPCVFVGRTADYITRDSDNMVSIFLHAEIDDRVKNICERTSLSDLEHAKEFIARKDKLREEYYNYFTGRNWGAANNYDLCFNTSKLDLSQIASIIIDYLDCRAKN